MKKFYRFVLLVSCSFQLSFVIAQQWYPSTIPYFRNINSVKILKPDVIVLAGGNQYNDSLQTLYRTDDRGLMWNFTDAISSWVRSIDFADTLHGFGVGFNGKMLNTVDGGRT